MIPRSAFWNDAFRLRVTLRHIEPAIWRRVQIPAIYSLAAVHDVFQIAFGWTNSHLHDFTIADVRIGMASVENELLVVDERGAPLGAVTQAGSSFVYQYDFGDCWAHNVVVEEILEGQGDAPPLCIDGARACPPEDCGGPPGYDRLLAALADPNDEEHAKLRTWVGKKYDPERFDLAAVNKKLATLGRRLQGGARRASRR